MFAFAVLEFLGVLLTALFKTGEAMDYGRLSLGEILMLRARLLFALMALNLGALWPQ